MQRRTYNKIGLNLGVKWMSSLIPGNEFAKGGLEVILQHLADEFTFDQEEELEVKQAIERGAMQITKSLNLLYEEEDLSEAHVEIIFERLEKAIKFIDISPEVLAERNYDYKYVAEQLRSFFGPQFTHSFSEPEEQYLDRLINETSRLIIHLNNKLPMFQVAGKAEILRRIARLETALSEFKPVVFTLNDLTLDAKDSKSEYEYRELILERLDRMTLFGVEIYAQSYRGQCVTHDFTTLQFELDSSDKALTSSTKVYNNGKSDLADAYEQSALSIPDVLQLDQRFLIRGEAGSGKTTILRWLAVHTVAGTLPEPLSFWNNRIPFYIKLRSYQDGKFPTPDEFHLNLSTAWSNPPQAGWATRIIKQSNRGLLLIDGVDEVLAQHRETVREWLDQLIEDFPNTPIILTSRPPAVSRTSSEKAKPKMTWSDWLNTNKFRTVSIQPLNRNDRNDLVDKWHHAVIRESGGSFEEAEFASFSEDLIKKLDTDLALAKLSSTPLLCAMICTVNAHNHGSLPLSNRAELYGEFLKTLLFARDAQRKVPAWHVQLPKKGLDRQNGEVLLQKFAWQMMLHGFFEAPTRWTLDTLKELFARQQYSRKDVETAREILLNRTGIFTEPRDGEISFLHLSFQEYLAAKYAARQELISVMIDRATDPRWRQSVVMCAALASKGPCSTLINGLLSAAENDTNGNAISLYLLAAACANSNESIDESLKSRTRRTLDKVFPAKSDDLLPSIVAAGELAFPYLTLSDKTPESSAIHARALREIGGPAAIAALANAANISSAVDNERFKAWAQNIEHHLVQRIPATLHSLVADEFALEVLNNIESFSFNFAVFRVIPPEYETLFFKTLSQVESLVSLYISPDGCELDYENAKNLPTLNHLGFMPGLPKLEYISQIKSLKHLTFLFPARSTDWNDLKQCSQVEQIDFFGSAPEAEFLPLDGKLKRVRNVGTELDLAVHGFRLSDDVFVR